VYRTAGLMPITILFAALGWLSGCAAPEPGSNATAQASPDPAPAATLVTGGQEVAAVAANKVEVTFPSGSTALTSSANHQLDLAVRLFRDANPVVMFSTGYSDQSGDEFSNLILSGRRAEVVKRGLVARGIPADRLLIQALGASELADSTEPFSIKNRRVVITWRLL
jgi:OOP family OmpA-OmpF porin